MSDEVVAGLIGAGGALIGAVITALVALAQQRKDAERERGRRTEDAAQERTRRAADAEQERIRRAEDAEQERRRWAADLERERERQEQERRAAEERAAENARVCARILLADLLQVELRLKQATAKNRYWSPRFELQVGSWQQYREAVARYMDLSAWSAVSVYFRSIGTLERQAAAARERANQPRPEFNEFALRQVVLALERSERAREALQAFSGDDTQLPETDLSDEAD